jgi:hypothetical protein
MLRLNDRGMVLYSPFTRTSAMNVPPLDSVILNPTYRDGDWDKLDPSKAIADPSLRTLHFLIFQKNPEALGKGYVPGSNFVRQQQVNWPSVRKGEDCELKTTPDSGDPGQRLSTAIDELKADIDKGVTHLVLFSHGWKQDDERACLRYAEFLNGMWRTLMLSPLRDRFLAPSGAPVLFKPLLVAVHWPSKGLFFYEREKAMAVGQSDLSQILWELVKYRHDSGRSFKIILAGHSFGNRVINGAVEGRTDPETMDSPYHFSKWNPAWAPVDAYVGFQPAMDIDVFHPKRCNADGAERLFCDVPVRVRRMVLSFSAFDYANRHAMVSDYMGYYGVEMPSSQDIEKLKIDPRLKFYGSNVLMNVSTLDQMAEVPVVVLSRGSEPGVISIGLLQVDSSGVVQSHAWPFDSLLKTHRMIKLDFSRFTHYAGTKWTYTSLKEEVPEHRVNLADPDENFWKKLFQRLGSGAHTDIYYPEIWLLMWQIVAAS